MEPKYKSRSEIKILEVPEICILNTEVIDDDGLSPTEKEAYAKRWWELEAEKEAKNAEHTITEIGGENIALTEKNGQVIWGGGTQEFKLLKRAISGHPLTATKMYLQGWEGWTKNELLTIVADSPEAAFWLSWRGKDLDKDKLNAIINTSPRYSYFLARETKTWNDETIEATAKSVYFHYLMLLDVINEPEKAQKLLETTAGYDAEAALTWFIETRPTERSEIPHQIILRLTLSPRHCYEALALNVFGDIQSNLGDDNEEQEMIVSEIRDTCLKDPQWAYHWLRDTTPENLNRYIAKVCWHSAWTEQLLSEIPEKTEKEKQIKDKLINIVISETKNIPKSDPHFTRLQFWIDHYKKTRNKQTISS